MQNHQTKTKIAALAFLTCFLVVSIISGAFILSHADHNHDQNGVGGGCETCAQIQSAETILKQFGIVLCGALFAIAGLYAAVRAFKAISVNIPLCTPVTLKIRLNN